MSTMTPYKGIRHTQTFTTQITTTSSNNPQSPQEVSVQAHSQNIQSTMKYSNQPTTPPRTPRRTEQRQPASQGKHNSNVPESGSRKPRNRNKPKNVQNSPPTTKADRTTPPLTAAQSTTKPPSARPIQTPSAAAYAGSTFHASPAPSALPMPSFYSKSVPESPRTKSGSGMMDIKPSTDEVSQTPSSVQSFSKTPRIEESPLDLFFNADKREKAEKMRAQSANSVPTASMGPFNPPLTSPGSTIVTPQHVNQTNTTNASSSRASASGLFAMELDGPSNSGMPLGPAFSTPYHERINAARKTSSPLQSQKASPNKPQSPLDRSEALKAYLFSQPIPKASEPSADSNLGPALSVSTNAAMSYQGGNSSPSGPRNSGMSTKTPQSNYRYKGESKSSTDIPKSTGSGLRREFTPSKTPTKTPDRAFNFAQTPTPSRVYESQDSTARASPIPNPSTGVTPGSSDADLRGMENSLRRLLKLDSPGVAGSAV
ncbi:proteophosphoglycan 5 protein [Rutstroemia sp. NJR-2017a BVV2]|nr:proteophosphoglycan 5 protein [Rutstroemia sp. NJR-2017a BVV2]